MSRIRLTADLPIHGHKMGKGQEYDVHEKTNRGWIVIDDAAPVLVLWREAVAIEVKGES